jgi:hypothetical protein
MHVHSTESIWDMILLCIMLERDHSLRLAYRLEHVHGVFVYEEYISRWQLRL